jgi:5-methylcytosine-specific restriction endonuclease McrA
MPESLPKPGSEALKKLLPRPLHQEIYEVLYRRRANPPDMHEIQAAVKDKDARKPQFNRRVREIRDVFVVEGKNVVGGRFVYELKGMRAAPKAAPGISKRVRAQVLKDQRCAMCGRTPGEDGVRLHVDHKVPREWGGTSDIDNLQALCSECNEGKRDFFSTFDAHAEKVKQAVNYDEPHRRIGELLKAFAPEDVPSDLLSIVASAKQYQDDWQKRLRELRVLGWRIKPVKQKVEGRVRVRWRLEHSEPWPKDSIRAEITRREKAGKAKKKN